MVVGVTVLLVTLASGTAHRQAHPAHSASITTGAHPLRQASRATQAPGSALRAQVSAVRRLARFGLPLFCGGRTKRMVALTFDDGPGVYTRLAVKKLHQHHVPATFFLVGKEIRAHPGLAELEESVAAFGDHTMTHPFLPALPYSQAVQEIAADQRLIERTVDEPVLLFRPPYEGHTPAIDAEVKTLGMVQVLWNVDSADSLGANYRGIEHNVIAGLHPGSIILMHENRGQTIRALDAIFAGLRRRHLEAVTVPQLIAADPPSPGQLRKGYAGCPVKLRNGSGGEWPTPRTDPGMRPRALSGAAAANTAPRRAAVSSGRQMTPPSAA